MWPRQSAMRSFRICASKIMNSNFKAGLAERIRRKISVNKSSKETSQLEETSDPPFNVFFEQNTHDLRRRKIKHTNKSRVSSLLKTYKCFKKIEYVFF